MTNPKESIPTPDPTRLTTKQLEKGITCLREVHEERMKCAEKLAELQQRFNEKLEDEKFASVQKLNDERRRFNEMMATAAEKAADKQNTASTKQIELQGSVLQTEVRGLYSKIDDSRNAITELKALAVSYATAKTEIKTDRRDSAGTIFGIVGIVIGIIAVIISLMKFGG